MIAIDTNLLVYAQRRDAAQHRAAKRAIEKACSIPHGWGIPLACIAEFWCVVTHPASTGGPSVPKTAYRFLDALVQSGGARIWSPGPGFWERLLQLASDMQITGARVFDLQIAITALDNGATELWSHDRAFAAPPGLVLHDPL